MHAGLKVMCLGMFVWWGLMGVRFREGAEGWVVA